MKHLFGCGSVVILPQTDWYEFWMPLLRPWRDFVPAANLRVSRGLDLPGIMQCLRDHADEAKWIGENSLRFANHVLRPAAEPAETYLSKLLPRVSALMQYGRETFPDRELPDRAQSGIYDPGLG